MKKIILILGTTMFLTACSNNKIETQLEGMWAIDQAYINNEPVIWNLYINCFNLETDNTCLLPVPDVSNRHTPKGRGNWEFLKENGYWYLKITSENDLFNRKFQIHNLRKEQDPKSWGYFMRMSLLSDSLTLDCTKALYIL